MFTAVTIVVVIFVAIQCWKCCTKQRVSLENKVVLITGAGSGLGRALATLFAKEKSHVICVDVNPTTNAETQLQINEAFANANVTTLTCNLADREDIERLARDVHERYPHGIDVLFNNAGVYYGGTVTDLKTEHVERTVAVNLSAHFHMVREFLPKMKRKSWACVAATSSILAFTPIPFTPYYSATKFAVRGFMNALKMDLNTERNSHVKTLTVYPGMMDTGMLPKVLRGAIGLKKAGGTWMYNVSPLTVARESIDAIKHGNDEIVSPFGYKIVEYASYLAPRLTMYTVEMFSTLPKTNLDPLPSLSS